MAASVPDATRECPCCGNVVPAQARFCNKCGMRLDVEPPPGSTSPYPTLEPLANEASPDVDTVVAASPFDQPTIMDPGPMIQEPAPEVAPARPRRLPFVVAGLAGASLAAVLLWLFLSPSSTPTVAAPPPPPVAQPLPPPSAVPVVPAPEPAAAEPAPAPTPASGATVVEAQPAPPPVARPFRNLVEPRPAEAVPAPTAEELRLRAERARRAEERRARELAAQQAREAAEREAAAQAAQPRSPEELCTGESGFMARNSCELRVCQQSQWMYHPFCMKRRELEEYKRRGGQ